MCEYKAFHLCIETLEKRQTTTTTTTYLPASVILDTTDRIISELLDKVSGVEWNTTSVIFKMSVRLDLALLTAK